MTDAESVLLSGMWWRCTDGSAHGLFFREDGPNQPMLQVTGKTWDDLMGLVEELGLETDLRAEDVSGGHPPERLDLLPDHALGLGLFYKGFRGKPIFYERRTDTTRVRIQANNYDDFVDFCERFGIDCPPKAVIKTLRQLKLISDG